MVQFNSKYFPRCKTKKSFQAKVETRALKAKRPGFTDERYNETTYFFENGNHHLYNTKQTSWSIVKHDSSQQSLTLTSY